MAGTGININHASQIKIAEVDLKPTSLKPGMRVLILPKYASGETYHGTFIERVPRHYCRAAFSIIRVDEFAGLNGAKCLGDTTFSDYEISRRVSLIKGDANVQSRAK